MTEIIREESSSTGLLVLLVVAVVAIGGFLLWRFLPSSQATNNTPSTVNVTLTPGAATGNTNSGY